MRNNGKKARGLFLGLLFLAAEFISQGAAVTAAPSARPKLIVYLIADQFPYDYLARFQDKFGNGGFRSLMDNGANFTHCRFEQATNQTACGQAVISSGAYPWASGIVADSWYDRKKGKVISASSISEEQTGNAGQLIGTTIGDQMKLASAGRSKVFTIALNDKASLLLGGRLADNAFWWDTRNGDFVSSGAEIPAWAKNFNGQRYAQKYYGKSWDRLLPENQYTGSTVDDYLYERALPPDGKQFPHIITGTNSAPDESFLTAFAGTPWANQMVIDFAKDIIVSESLGQHSTPDFIGVNFSATEVIGKSYGPYSQESEDLVLRLDQTIAGFLQFLDQKVGLDNCLVVFTADHGVASIPEFLKEKGIDAGRIDAKIFARQLNAAMETRLGKGDWIEAFEPPNLYLNLNTIDHQERRQPDIEALAAKLAHSLPGTGEVVYSAFQFFLNQVPNGPYAAAVRKSYFWGRSGELFVIPKPGYVFVAENEGTASGSPYAYDAQVPLFLHGGAIKPGCYNQVVAPADIAPTTAAILGINAPSLSEGSVLHEVIGGHGPTRTRGQSVSMSTTEQL